MLFDLLGITSFIEGLTRTGPYITAHGKEWYPVKYVGMQKKRSLYLAVEVKEEDGKKGFELPVEVFLVARDPEPESTDSGGLSAQDLKDAFDAAEKSGTPSGTAPTVGDLEDDLQTKRSGGSDG